MSQFLPNEGGKVGWLDWRGKPPTIPSEETNHLPLFRRFLVLTSSALATFWNEMRNIISLIESEAVRSIPLGAFQQEEFIPFIRPSEFFFLFLHLSVQSL